MPFASMRGRSVGTMQAAFTLHPVPWEKAQGLSHQDSLAWRAQENPMARAYVHSGASVKSQTNLPG
jgi:hypothetical protein